MIETLIMSLFTFISVSGLYILYLKEKYGIYGFILSIILFGLSFFLLRRKKEATESEKKAVFLFSFVVILIHLVGSVIYKTHHIAPFFLPVSQFLLRCVFSVSSAFVLSRLFSGTVHRIWSCLSRPKAWCHPGQIQFLCFVLFFFSYFICFLAYDPGIIAYDMSVQSRQALGFRPITRFHPPLHTFIWAVCLRFSHFSGLSPLYVYGIFQMVILAFTESRFQRFLMDSADRRWFFLSFLFFLLNPVIAIFAGIMVKDVLFGIILLNFSVDLYRLPTLSSKHIGIRLFVDAILCMLLRNNAVYAFLVLSVILLIIRSYKVIRWSMMASVICYLLINGPIFDALGIMKGEANELLSVPVQQIGAVVIRHPEESEVFREPLSEYMDYDRVGNDYNPRFADSLKNSENGILNGEHFLENPTGFFKVWWDMCTHYPEDAISAFLDLGIQFWYLGAKPIDPYANRAYIETYLDPYTIQINQFDIPLERTKWMPHILNFYESFATGYIFSGNFLEYFFSYAVPFWIIVLCLFFSLAHSQSIPSINAGLLLLLIGTFLLGPVCNCRYLFFTILQLPLLLLSATGRICVKDNHSYLKKRY